jgi:putative hydrolases of HD superfamily
MNAERLNQQIRFIREVDKLKQVYRQTLLMDGSRYENDAEHSWHLALAALLLAEYAEDRSVDMARVVKMILVHDLVEIDAGDTYCYDAEANQTRPAREAKAAERLFGLLPSDQADEMRGLWAEFEARTTPEARFAAGLDRLQPLLHNYVTGGVTWRDHGVRASQVRERNRHMSEGSKALWEFAQGLIDESIAKGYLAP